MADYIIQKAVNADTVKKKLQRSLEEYGRTFLAQSKYDGCCAVLRRDEDVSLTVHSDSRTLGFSRTGEYYPSLSLIADELETAFGGRYVFIGEAWWPGKDQFSLISGDFRRQQPSERLRLIVNDILTHEEFEAGFSPVPYRERRRRVDWADYGLERVEPCATWAPGTYGCPQAMCNQLVELGGYDGLILRDPEGTWTRGRGTTGEIVKIKRVLSYDLRVLEVNTVPGAKTGRPVHKLVVDFNGKRLGVGSGVPHDIADCPVVGDIVEVEAMDLSSEGLLREPRFKGIRYDKLEADAA